MTWVKSRLVDPAGSPIEGVCVKAALVMKPTWLADASSQVVSRAMTHTGPDGVWRLNLVPFTAYESQLAGCAFYHVTEDTRPPTLTAIRVPEADETDELWMRDLVFDPDPCARRNGFIPINTLARLHDVDAASLALAKPGDFLVLMPNGKWGAARGPMPLTVSWTPDPDDMMTVRIVVVGFGGAGARVGFGDGSPEETVHSYEPISHIYKEVGTYIVTATDVAWPAFAGSTKVGIKDHMPRAHVYQDGDDDWRALLWIDENADDTIYSIDWGDSTPLTHAGGQNHGRVPPRPRVPHQYKKLGIYDIVITDNATKRQTRRQFEANEFGVLITFDTPTRTRTEVLWLATGATWEFDPDGFPPSTGIVPASGRVTRVASFDLPPGEYPGAFREVVNGQVRRAGRRSGFVPTQWDWRMDVVLTWRANDDPLGMQTVTAIARGARTRCTVEWGDGTASEVVDPGQPVSHRYQLPAPTVGWRFRLTETQVEDPRTWTRVFGEPQYVGTPTQSARSRGAVDLAIAGLDNDYNDDWYAVAWEAGSPPDPVAAVGRLYPANHVYNTPGRKQIVVDGPGMATPITREIDVVFYPTPIITAVEERNNDGKVIDPTRMTVRISVDNTANGGSCTVRLGDGSTPRRCAETDSFAYQYPVPGTYYPIVASDADPTAKGRATVVVPYGTPRTLFYDLAGEPGGYEVTCTVTGRDPAKGVQVQWESSGPWTPVPPSNEVSNTYPSIEDVYDITVAYSDESEQWTTTVDIPWTPGVLVP